MDKKLLTVEEQLFAMLKHSHNKEERDYLTPPPLPSEDMDITEVSEVMLHLLIRIPATALRKDN